MNKQTEKEGFFAALENSPSADTFLRDLWKDNPVFVQVLGMCPVLAVTNTAENALAMGLATAFVLLMSNVLVSALRISFPSRYGLPPTS